MGGTVVADLEVVSLCEATTGWTGSPTPTLRDATIWDQIQGNDCLQSSSNSAVVRNAAYDFGATSGFWKSFAGKILVIWFAISKKTYSATNPPMKIRLTDGSGYYRDWYIFDKTTLPNTGWIPWVIHADVGYDYESNVLFDVTKIRYVGWRIEETVVAKTYIWWDAVRWGTGLTIKGGTSDPYDPSNLEKLYTEDIAIANAYGIISKLSGVYYSYGKITIGSLTPNESTYFKDLNQVLIFNSIKGNPTGFHEIKGQNATSGSGTTKIFFGEKPATAGISGLFIRAPSTIKWKLTMSDTYITEFGFYGCTFVYADTITGQAYSTVKEFLNTNFIICAEVLPNTGIVKYCKFISSPSSAIKISSASHNITYCDFISCVRGVHIEIITPFTLSYNALSFFTCTKDGYNTSTAIVTVSYNPACSPPPSSWEGTYEIVYQISIDLIVRHVKTGSEPAEYVRCAIYKKSSMTEIMNKDATVADDQNPTYYKASQSYTVTGIVVIVRAREKGYLPFETELTIPSGGLDVTAVWIVDPNYQP